MRSLVIMMILRSFDILLSPAVLMYGRIHKQREIRGASIEDMTVSRSPVISVKTANLANPHPQRGVFVSCSPYSSSGTVSLAPLAIGCT